MNFKTTYILFGVLTLVLLVFGLSLYLGPTAKDSEPFVFPSLHNPIDRVDDKAVVEVEINRNQPQKEKFVFKRDGDTDNWLIVEPRSLRGNSVNIKGMVTSLIGARRDTKADKVTNADAVGLSDPPEAKVILTLKNGKLLTLKLGKTSGGTTSAVTYVISSDRPNVIQAATKADLSEVNKDLAYFRDKELLTAAEGDIHSIAISEVKDGKEVGSPVELAKRQGNWVYVKPFTGEADLQADTSPATPGHPPAGQLNILNALTNLRADYVSDKENDFVADNVTDWAKYHLDPKSDLLKVTIQRVVAGPKKDTKDNEPKETGDKLETITVFVGLDKKADERTNKYYARRSDENDVIKVPATAVDPLRELLKTPDALRDRHLVDFNNFKEPDAIDIKNYDGLLEFRRLEPSKPWEMYRGTVKQDLNQGMIKGLLTQLEDRRKDITFLDPKTVKESELGLDKPAAVVSFWVDGIEKPEPKEDKDEKKDGKDEKKEEKKEEVGKPKLKNPTKPNVKLLFAPKVGGKDTVVKREVEGSAPDYLRVPDVIFERITQGPLAYLERKLPKFVDGINPTKDVTNLLYEQGGSIVEVKRDKPNEGPWKIVQPKSLAGREADPATVDAILQTLNNLEADKLVAEKPSADELDRTYGLKNPSAHAVVTVQKDGKPTTFTISFGKEEGQDLYARMSQRDMVFTILKSAIASFKEPILDKVVFRFDPSKVKEIKLRRWNKDLEAPGDQVLVKDGNDWKVKGSDQKVKNPKRYNDLIEALHNLRVVKFLEGAVKAEYELGYDKGALGIEVTVEGEKEPYQLILGKEESDGYVAQSKQLGDQLFVVGKTPFKEFR